MRGSPTRRSARARRARPHGRAAAGADRRHAGQRARRAHAADPSRLAPLLPGGALRSGSPTRRPARSRSRCCCSRARSAAGAWCGVVGMPEFGTEAAAGLGVALDRLVLVPDPGEHWLAVTAQLTEVLPVVLVRPPARGASPAETARLASRLRQRDATLLVAGPWSGRRRRSRPTGGSWSGIGAGWGYLAARELDVAVTAREIRTLHRVRIETTGLRLTADLRAGARAATAGGGVTERCARALVPGLAGPRRRRGGGRRPGRAARARRARAGARLLRRGAGGGGAAGAQGAGGAVPLRDPRRAPARPRGRRAPVRAGAAALEAGIPTVQVVRPGSS